MSSNYQRTSVFTPFLRRFTDERARDLSETIALYDEVRAAHRASPWAQEGAIDRASTVIAEMVGEVFELPDSKPLLEAFDQCQKTVLALETTIFSSPEIDWNIATLSLKEQVDLRRFFRAQQHFLGNHKRIGEQLAIALGNVIGGIIGALPKLPAATDQPLFTVPLISLVPDPRNLVDRIIGTLYTPELADAGLFTTLQERIYENICYASDVSPDDTRTKRLIPAADSDLPPTELVETYLKDTPFHDLLFVPVPFTIPHEARIEHTHIIAGSGHGKTQLLQHIILDDIVSDEAPALVIIDSQGQMLRKIQNLALFDPNAESTLADSLIIIDPEDTVAPPALNMFDPGHKRFHMYSPTVRETLEAGTIELYNYIFGSIASEMTQKQGTAFAFVIKLMFAIPGANIRTLRDIMEEDVTSLHESRFAPHIGRLDEDSQTFFKNQFFHKTAFRPTKEQIAHRLYGLLQTPAFARMFSSPIRKLDMFECLQNRRIVLINTSKSLLKTAASQLFGRYMIALTMNAAYERIAIPEKQWHKTYLFVDEAAEYFDENTQRMLEQARKFNLGVVLAHQQIEGQLSDAVKAAIATNTSIKFAGGLSHHDANAMSKDMRCDPSFLLAQRKSKQSTQFACYVRNYTDTAVSLTVPLGMLEHQDRMSPEAQDLLLKVNRERVADTQLSGVQPRPQEPPPAAQVPTTPPGPPTPPLSTHPISTAPPLPSDSPQSAPDNPEAGSTW